MGSTKATSDQELSIISGKLAARSKGSQLKRVLSICMHIAMVSRCPTLIYKLAIKENIFGKHNFLPAAIPPCAMILLDLTNLKRAGLSQKLDENRQETPTAVHINMSICLALWLMELTKRLCCIKGKYNLQKFNIYLRKANANVFSKC